MAIERRLALPSHEHIEEEAYRLWEARGRNHGGHVWDWLAAERDLEVLLNYNTMVNFPLWGDKRTYLGDKARRHCRFCKRERPAAKFKKEAHAVSMTLGNRNLISLEECDDCNEKFGKLFEDDLGKFMLPFRIGSAIRGRRGHGKLKIEDSSGETRIEFSEATKGQVVTGIERPGLVVDDEDNKQIRISMPTQPFRPLSAYKGLVKAAISVIPEQQLGYFPGTLHWLSMSDISESAECFAGSGCHLYSLPGTYYRTPFIHVWDRKRDTDFVPHMMVAIGIQNILIQYVVPLSLKDLPLLESAQDQSLGLAMPLLGTIHPLETREPVFQAVDLSSPELDPTFTVTSVADYRNRTFGTDSGSADGAQ